MNIYTTVTLNNGDVVTMIKLTGLEWFNASLRCEKLEVINMYLLCESCYVNKKLIDMEYVKSIDIEDLMMLFEIINNQMINMKGIV